MDKFLKYCEQNNISCGFVHNLSPDLLDSLKIALSNKKVETIITPYGDMFNILNWDMEFKEIKEPKYCVDNLMYYHLIHEKIIPFWKPNGNYGFCSQWYKSEFKDDLNIKYNCAEQYMMAQKALLFNDEIIYNKIMHEYNPSEIKRLGRLIRNFDSIIWDTMKYEIVFRGNMLKFSQNKSLAKKLKDTGKNILVEASPYDYVWGIGISEFSDNINEPELWPGKNLLGFALMEVRDNI